MPELPQAQKPASPIFPRAPRSAVQQTPLQPTTQPSPLQPTTPQTQPQEQATKPAEIQPILSEPLQQTLAQPVSPTVQPQLNLPPKHTFAFFGLLSALALPALFLFLILLRFILQFLGTFFFGNADYSFYSAFLTLFFSNPFFLILGSTAGLGLAVFDFIKLKELKNIFVLSSSLLSVFLLVFALLGFTSTIHQILLDQQTSLHDTLREYFSVQEHCQSLKLQSSKDTCLQVFTATDSLSCEKVLDPIQRQQCTLLLG
ncbi:hypothetical protein HZB00_00150 [Candidatus Woesearchaeota archaeon]|nr:hypothetical protein [Candidatus Woesearchaeota archaeon]